MNYSQFIKESKCEPSWKYDYYLITMVYITVCNCVGLPLDKNYSLHWVMVERAEGSMWPWP